MAFTAGQKVRASDLNMTPGYTGPATAPASTTSTAYVYVRDSSSNILAGKVFTAPPSGKVTVSFGVSVNSSAGGSILVSIAVLTGSTIGSGTSFLAAADQNAFGSTAEATVPGSRQVEVDGLTAGTVYNVGVLWKIASGTAAGSHPWISVRPELS